MKTTAYTLVIDNYDSFTYNMVEQLRLLGEPVLVKRNDAFSDEDVEHASRILFSPGPGIPQEAGRMPELIQQELGKKPMLGICLGHQCIAEAFGAKLRNLDRVFHGIASEVKQLEAHPLFDGIPETFQAGRYHSWVVEQPLPEALQPLALSTDGQLMAFAHRELPVYGLQFHPESLLTPEGGTIIHNFLKLSASVNEAAITLEKQLP